MTELAFELPIPEGDPTTPRIDSFRARVICEFDRRHVPEMEERYQREFIASLVRKSMDALTSIDILALLAENEALLTAPVSVIEDQISPLALVKRSIAQDIASRLYTRAGLGELQLV